MPSLRNKSGVFPFPCSLDTQRNGCTSVALYILYILREVSILHAIFPVQFSILFSLFSDSGSVCGFEFGTVSCSWKTPSTSSLVTLTTSVAQAGVRSRRRKIRHLIWMSRSTHFLNHVETSPDLFIAPKVTSA